MPTQLLQPTDPGTPLRVVFVPSSHYTEPGGAGLADFNQRVSTMFSNLSNHVFFRRYLDRMAVWRIDSTTTKDLSTDSRDRNIFGNDAEVLKWVQKKVPDFEPANDDVVVFCMGVPAAGNIRGDHRSAKQPMNVVNMAFDGAGAFVHEFGHAFADLGDEYSPQKTPPAPQPSDPNIALQNSPGYTCNDKWGELLGLTYHPHPDVPDMMREFTTNDTVGCVHITGSRASNWYRPVNYNRCIMDKGGTEYPFCPVCHRHLEKLMHGYGTGETRVTFDRLPDGHEITQPLGLQGNEFLPLGVAFEPDPIHYAARLKTQPAVLQGAYGAAKNCLAMVKKVI